MYQLSRERQSLWRIADGDRAVARIERHPFGPCHLAQYANHLRHFVRPHRGWQDKRLLRLCRILVLLLRRIRRYEKESGSQGPEECAGLHAEDFQGRVEVYIVDV